MRACKPTNTAPPQSLWRESCVPARPAAGVWEVWRMRTDLGG